MTEQDYQKLNNYLNIFFKQLEKKDKLFLENIEFLCSFCINFRNKIKEKDIVRKEIKENFNFNDVFLLSRKIIESINPNYLTDFDKLIESGRLDFDFEQISNDSYFNAHYNENELKNWDITVRRQYSVNDVEMLVHEFIHYINCEKRYCLNVNRYLLTEFLSIYYEIYALDYLEAEEKYPLGELNYEDRICSIIKRAEQLDYIMPLLEAYHFFGKVDESSPLLLEKYRIVKDTSFEKECKSILSYFEKKEKKLYMQKLYEEEYHEHSLPYEEEELALKLIESLSDHYRYFLGTLCAYYARKYCNPNDILWLNEHINDDEVASMPTLDVLKKVGIILNRKTMNEMISCIEEQIKRSNVCKK